MTIYMLKDYIIILVIFGLCRQHQFFLTEEQKEDCPFHGFLNEANDSLHGILDLWSENVWLAAKGGGIGSYWEI